MEILVTGLLFCITVTNPPPKRRRPNGFHVKAPKAAQTKMFTTGGLIGIRYRIRTQKSI